jgi:hypothetical protein
MLIMVDIGTGLAIIGGKDLLFKILGLTADYVGNETKNLVEKSCKNIKLIFIRAVNVLGSKIDSPGQVSPRILKRIFDDGAFCEDELTLEYFGGVLASSRNNNSRDDRGLTFVSLLESMSSYQIRTHYIFHTILRKKYAGVDINFEDNRWIQKMQVFVPFDEFLNSIDLDLPDRSRRDTILPHIFWGLRRLNLISDFGYGNTDTVRMRYLVADGPGFVILPTEFGIEFYMWANGHSDIPVFSFIDNNIQFVSGDILEMPSGAIAFSSDES